MQRNQLTFNDLPEVVGELCERISSMENLLKEKNICKNKLCEACNLQRTQLNNYCKNKVTRIDFTILAKLCEFLDCTPNDILKLK